LACRRYLHDYDNWTNAQINAAMAQDNYNMTVESWREQRSYVVNAIGLVASDPQYVADDFPHVLLISSYFCTSTLPDCDIAPLGWASLRYAIVPSRCGVLNDIENGRF
jgi:hypothetical protein